MVPFPAGGAREPSRLAVTPARLCAGRRFLAWSVLSITCKLSSRSVFSKQQAVIMCFPGKYNAVSSPGVSMQIVLGVTF
jgi:hypothetical protein